MSMNLGAARASAAVNWFKPEWLPGVTVVRIWPPDQIEVE